MSKSLQKDSQFNGLDTNGDGIVSDAEFEQSERMIKLELLRNEDNKQDAQLRMCWFALISMLVYPALIMLSAALNMERAATLIAEMSSIFFLSVGGLVSIFFGSQAIKKNGNGIK